MPEGPEAKTISDSLRPHLEGFHILGVHLTETAKQEGLEKIVLPAKIVSVYSYGKKVCFELESKQTIVTSLGMSGRYMWKDGDHTRVYFSIGKVLRAKSPFIKVETRKLYFNCIRRFGGIELLDPGVTVAEHYGLGPDMLRETIDTARWLSLFRNPKIQNWQICKVLLDTKYNTVSSIGNYLKSEILYRAQIRPDRMLKDMSDHDLEVLRVHSHNTIRESYSAGGLTINDYWDPEGRKGVFQTVVYKQTHDPQGNSVVVDKFKDGRSTYWVPDVQM